MKDMVKNKKSTKKRKEKVLEREILSNRISTSTIKQTIE
jgi:hypothetical protein